MASIKSENFDELCRLCASYDAIKMDIFGDRGRERKLLEKIHTCLPFHVAEEDALPKSLCYRCIYNLENFYDFRKGCVEAVSRLENFVSVSDADTRKVSTQYDVASDDDDQSVISVRSDYSESQEPNPADFLEARMDNEPMQTSRNENHVREQVIEVNAGSFACPACPKSFSNMSALILHSKLHMASGSSLTEKKEQRMFPCPVCEKSFLSKGNLSNHVKTHSFEPNTINRQSREANSSVRPFQCELCSKTYVVAKHLWGHVSTSHRGDPRVTCPYCSRTFSTPANLEEHKRSKHMHERRGHYQEAEENSLTMADSVSLDNESQDSREAAGKSVTEEFCGSRRKNTKPRKIARELSNDKDNCNSFSQADTEEESVTNEISNKSCLLCAKTFSNRSGLRRHLFNVHGLDPNEVEAQTSGMHSKVFKNEMDESEMVESLVEAETVFCCEVCVREFNDRASLWLHMLYSHREEAATACGICLRVCSDNISLSEHIHSCHPKDSLGTEKRRYSCQICARQHDSRKKLVAHVKIHNLMDEEGNALNPESMVILNNDFYSHDQSLRNAVDDDYSLSCEICYKHFPSEVKLMKHKRNAHKDSQKLSSSNTYNSYFSCELCGLSHATRTERWKHVFRSHSDDPSLVCELESCGKVFPTRALKVDHSNTHHQQQGDMPNTCEICGNIWATRINYWKHMMGIHRDSLPFICGVCLKIFVSIPDLASHVQEKHKTTDTADFSCDICGRPYSKKSKMSRHRKIHNIPFSEGGLQEGQFESQAKSTRGDDSLVQLRCEECPSEEFLDLEELSEHRRTAHNLVPCDLCPKYYGRTSHLWKHVNKIHKGHEDITCSICLRTSASRVHLSKHFAKHHRALSADNANWNEDPMNNSTGEAIHTCTKCSKVFRKDHLMQQHFKHCTGPRTTPVINNLSVTANGTFQCDKCSKVCDTRSNLNKHIKASHIMYPCELCEDESKNEQFDTKTKLFDHILQAHHGHPDLTCDVPNCFRMLRMKKDLLKHRREHRQGYPTQTCDFCGELISNRIKLRKHLKSNHAQHSKWVCYVCTAVKQSYESLGEHIKENHAVLVGRPNICPICAKRCADKYKLTAHIKIHGEEFVFCERCVLVFQSKEEFNEHCKTHEDDEDDEQDKSRLKRQHSDEDERAPKKIKYDSSFEPKEFKPCVMIPNKTILDRSLNSSASTSSKNRKVYEGDDEDCICELCGRVWASKKQLWQHLIRSHSTDAATACGVCLKMCNNYVNLDMHVFRKHPGNFDGEANHLNCRICGKFHPYYVKLMNHIVIHIGEEKRAQDLIFACSVCKSVFETQTSLCEHNVENHSDMIIDDDEGEDEEDDEENSEEKLLHTCEVCDEEFDDMELFLEHNRSHRLQQYDESSELSEPNNSRTRISEEESTNMTAGESPKTLSEVEEVDLDQETDQIDEDENLTNSSTFKDSVEDNVESILSDTNKESLSDTIDFQRTEEKCNVETFPPDQLASNNQIKEEICQNNTTLINKVVNDTTVSAVSQFVSNSTVTNKKLDEQVHENSFVKKEINALSEQSDLLQTENQELSNNISEQDVTDLVEVLSNQTTDINLMEV